MSARFPASKLPIAATPHYVNGEYVASPTGEELAVVDAATEEVIWVCREATPLLVDDAFRAARNAFGLWSTTTGAMRATVLRAIATGVKEHHEALSRLECHMGKILSEARWDVDDVVACFEYYAERAEAEDASGKRAVELPDEEYVCEVRREPIGVVAAITPWNYPLLMATWKLAPALAAGCTVVLKPSELAPLSSVKLGAICARAGLPRGVLNILVGGGAVGAAMAAHAEADKVSFTGSEASGIKVSLAAAPTVKNVSLELGGKSAILVFDDGVDLDHAVEWVMFGCFWTNGRERRDEPRTARSIGGLHAPRWRFAHASLVSCTRSAGSSCWQLLQCAWLVQRVDCCGSLVCPRCSCTQRSAPRRLGCWCRTRCTSASSHALSSAHARSR